MDDETDEQTSSKISVDKQTLQINRQWMIRSAVLIKRVGSSEMGSLKLTQKK